MTTKLLRLAFAGLFSGIDDFCIVSRPAERIGIRQMIVNDDVRVPDALLCAQRDQTKITWPGANQIDFSAFIGAFAHPLNFA